ncbi:hypothetical protein P8452_40862 [Trifolium repens]|nr:hypothetical protein P8452_40862 [Trifolium repens]
MFSVPSLSKLLFPVDLVIGVTYLSTPSVFVESTCSSNGKLVIASSARLAIDSLNSASSSSLETYMPFILCATDLSTSHDQ